MCNKVTINKWIDAKAALDHAKKVELELRNKVIQDMKARNPSVEEGTRSHEFGNIKISVTFKTSKSVDEAALDSIWGDLSDSEKEVFKYKPSIIAKNYKELEASPNIISCVTIKPSQASVAFKIDQED